MSGAAAGLGALGFWLFIAAIIVAGIWYDARRKESQQETLRRVVESGRDIDPVVLDRILGTEGGRSLERDLKVAALIVLFAAPGLALLGLFLGQIAAEARAALLGTSLLVGFVGAGLYLAARLVERRYADQKD
jgi:predicted permease